MGNTVGSWNKTSLKNLSRTTQAFIAGFLEGDGCISARITPTSGSYRVLIVIGFTQRQEGRAVLEYLSQFLHEPIADYRMRNMSELLVRDRAKVAFLLHQLLPFLVSKKKQAELALQVIEILERSKRGERRTAKNLLEAVRLAEQIRSLNSNRRDKIVHTLQAVQHRLRERGFVS